MNSAGPCYLCGHDVKRDREIDPLLGVLLRNKVPNYKYCLVHLNAGEKLRVDRETFVNSEYRRKWRVFHYYFTGHSVKVQCTDDI